MAEVDIATGGAFDGGADVLREHQAVEGFIAAGEFRDDADGDAEWDEGAIDRQATARRELHAKGTGGFFRRFGKEDEAGVAVEDFIGPVRVGLEPCADAIGRDVAGEFALVAQHLADGDIRVTVFAREADVHQVGAAETVAFGGVFNLQRAAALDVEEEGVDRVLQPGNGLVFGVAIADGGFDHAAGGVGRNAGAIGLALAGATIITGGEVIRAVNQRVDVLALLGEAGLQHRLEVAGELAAVGAAGGHLHLGGEFGEGKGELVRRVGQTGFADLLPVAVGAELDLAAAAGGHGAGGGLAVKLGTGLLERAVEGDIVGTEGGEVPVRMGRRGRTGGEQGCGGDQAHKGDGAQDGRGGGDSHALYVGPYILPTRGCQVLIGILCIPM